MGKVYRLTLMSQEEVPAIGFIDLLKEEKELGIYSNEDIARSAMMDFVVRVLHRPLEQLKQIGHDYNWKAFSVPGIPSSRRERFTIWVCWIDSNIEELIGE